MKKQNKYDKKEVIIIIGISLLLVFGILIGTGTLFSGYHLVDDHEIIRRVYVNRNSPISLWDKIFDGFPWITIRFRPLYIVLRRIRGLVFLDNFVCWSIWVGLEIVLIILFAYLIARMFDCNKYMSFLFGCIIVIGEQSAVWWRLGPQEPTGLLLLLVSFFFLQKYEVYSDRKWLVGGSLAAILSSFTKESFTLFLPFIPFLVVAYDIYIEDIEHTLIYKWRKSIKKNLLLFPVCIIVFLFNLVLILTKVGTDLDGYAGLDNSLGVLGYIRRIGGMLLFRFSIYFWALVFVGLGCLVYIKIKKIDSKRVIRKNCFLFIIVLAIIAVQLVLHAKSGMFERYFIPTIVPIALIFIVIVNSIIGNSKNLVMGYQIILTILMLWLLTISVIPEAKSFAREGQVVAECIEKVQSEANSNSKIVVALDMERDYAFETFLELKLGYNDVISYEAGSFLNQIDLKSDGDIIKELNEVEYIIGNNSSEYDNFTLIGDYDTIKLWKNAEL